jgi:hypothetical protein
VPTINVEKTLMAAPLGGAARESESAHHQRIKNVDGEPRRRCCQIIHLELPTMHKPLVIAPAHLAVPCISESCLPSCFIDKVDIIAPELLLCDFVVCLNTGGDHDDFWRDNRFGPIHQEERRLPRSPT